MSRPQNVCYTCAHILDEPAFAEKADLFTEKPLRNRTLPCCGRLICAPCIAKNARFADYCPFCQTTRLPKLPREKEPVAGPSDPPPYSDIEEDAPAQSSPPSPPPSYASTTSPPSLYNPSSTASTTTDTATTTPTVTHHLHPSDTLASLSLAYAVPASAIRAHNRLFADALLPGRRTLAIPGARRASLSPRPVEDPAERARKVALRRFMLRSRCADYEVARVYLEEVCGQGGGQGEGGDGGGDGGWDVDRAVERWWADEEWERRNPLGGKGRRPGRGAALGR